MNVAELDRYVKQRINEAISELHTNLIGKIIEINEDETLCRVEFLQKDIRTVDNNKKVQANFDNTDWIPLFPIFESSDFLIKASASIGDKVIIQVSERPISEPLTSDVLNTQQRFGKMNISDTYIAKFIPKRIYEKTVTNKGGFSIIHKKLLAKIEILEQGEILVETEKDINIKGKNLTIDVENFTVNAEAVTINASTIDLNGTLNINGTPYLSHTHGGVQTGGGTTGGVS